MAYCRLFAMLMLLTSSLLAQTGSPTVKVDPNTQINWTRATGSGAPATTCGAPNYGAPYTDTTGNKLYVCTPSGWVQSGAAANAVSIQGVPVSAAIPVTVGQYLAFDGAQYSLQTPAAGTGNITGGSNGQPAYYCGTGTTICGAPNALPTSLITGNDDTQTLTNKTAVNLIMTGASTSVPTAAPGTNNTQPASTAFVQAAVTASTTGVVSINGLAGVYNFTGSVSCSTVLGVPTCNFTGGGGSSITPVAITVSAFTAVAHGCYDKNGTLNAVTTVTMTGLTTAMAPHWSFTGNPTSLSGWGSTSGMAPKMWATANTLNAIFCNVTGSSIITNLVVVNVEP